MLKIILLTLIFTYASMSQYTFCSSCPEGAGWVGPITVLGDQGVECDGTPCYLWFKYCYRLPSPPQNNVDI